MTDDTVRPIGGGPALPDDDTVHDLSALIAGLDDLPDLSDVSGGMVAVGSHIKRGPDGKATWWAMCFHDDHGIPENLEPDEGYKSKTAAKAAARAHRKAHLEEDRQERTVTCHRCGHSHECVGRTYGD